ncbi:MAG: glycosyltransferase family 39 protein [Planctomycetes bacterium]|nr:glycosyltransferase family 39 protein [Planctomycetota bacterium]
MTGLRLFLLAFCGFFALAHGNVENLDATMTLHSARALWLRGDSGLRAPDQAPEWTGEMRIAAHVRAEAAAGRHAYGKVGQSGLVYVWFPVGYLWAMLPAVALGTALERAYPEVEATFRERTRFSPQTYQHGEFLITTALVSLVLPALCGALCVLALWRLAKCLGAAPRDALWTTAAITLASQMFPLGRENLSDGPGLACLLWALYAVLRVRAGGAAGMAALGGLLAGGAVLCRYQHAFLVPLLLVALGPVVRAPGGLRRWLAFAAGGLPCLCLLLAVNHARFGSIGDTGYPPFGSWFNYPTHLGLLKLLVAAGKGVLWLSPLLWLALPALCRRALVPELRWLAAVAFAVPMLLFGSTNGWQSGQCWGARYVTPGVVLLLAVVLPQARPWAHLPRRFALLCAFGLFANATSVVAPTRGYNQLAAQGVAALYDRELAAGTITPADRAGVDAADHFFFLPRFSPLHANWTYAYQSWRGAFETDQGRPRDGSAHTIEALFGIAAAPGHEAEQGRAPVHWEDRGGRHLWWVFWAELYGGAPWRWGLGAAAPLLLVLGWLWRRRGGAPAA